MSFHSLQSIRTGLFASQRALELIGKNVSNANTAGYTRQDVSFAAAEPTQVITSAGRGIAEATVVRYRDEFLDRQFRSRAGSSGYHQTMSDSLAQVEEIIGDLGEGGLRSVLDGLFSSFENLSLYPSQPTAKIQAVEAAEAFITMARRTFDEMAQLRSSINGSIETKVKEINSATQQLADLNQKILSGESSPDKANGLRDRRDVLLDSLAKLAGVTAVKAGDGTVTVHLGSLPLVMKDSAYPIDATTALEPDMDANPTLVSIRQELTSLTWNGTALPAKFQSGEMAALLELRDQRIPDQMKALDNLVRSVATEMNIRHGEATMGAGVPPAINSDIFSIGPTGDWMAIAVDPTLKANPAMLVAGYTAGPTDGERARYLAAVRDVNLLTGPPVGTIQVNPVQYLQSISTDLGVQVHQAESRSAGAALQVEQAEKHRQSTSGVSIDDEMTKMIQFQQAYNAAARMMTSIDEMLDTMINRTGLVGR